MSPRATLALSFLNHKNLIPIVFIHLRDKQAQHWKLSSKVTQQWELG